MAGKKGGQKADKSGHRPKALPDSEVAEILFYAETHTTKETAEKFRVSERSVRRYRADEKGGACPEVTRLVRVEREALLVRNRDLICETVDKALRELQSRFGKLSDKDLIDAIDKVGALRVTQEALNGNRDEPADAAEQGPGAEAHAGAASGGPPPAPRGPAIGATGAAGTGGSPVH